MDEPITQPVTQPIGDYTPYPTDRPVANMLEVCGSPVSVGGVSPHLASPLNRFSWCYKCTDGFSVVTDVLWICVRNSMTTLHQRCRVVILFLTQVLAENEGWNFHSRRWVTMKTGLRSSPGVVKYSPGVSPQFWGSLTVLFTTLIGLNPTHNYQIIKKHRITIHISANITL